MAKKEKIELQKTNSAEQVPQGRIFARYEFVSNSIPVVVTISTKKGEYVPIYDVSISRITKNTEILLEKIRQELTSRVSLGIVDITEAKDTSHIEEKFTKAISDLISKYLGRWYGREQPGREIHAG